MRLQLILMQLLRLVIYKTVAVIRTCVNITVQMWLLTKAQSFYASLSRSKKLLLAAIIFLVLLLYLWPSWVNIGETRKIIAPEDLCIDSKLNRYSAGVSHYDIIINHQPLHEGEVRYLPYVGNGYLGASLEEKSLLHIRHGRAIHVPVKFYPTVQVHIEGYQSREAHVIDLRSGLVSRVQCFQVDPVCVSVLATGYAHRKRPTLLVQEFRVENPTNTPVTLELKQIGVSDWQDTKTYTQKMTSGRRADVEYSVVMGVVTHTDYDESTIKYQVAIATMQLPTSTSVKEGSTWTFQTITAVKFAADVTIDINTLAKEAEKELSTALNIEPSMLRQEHTQLWNQFWSSGFGISPSKASGAINGDKINMTIYYISSHNSMPGLEEGHSSPAVDGLKYLLFYPDRCYEGHHTLQNSKMWQEAGTVDTMIDLVRMWMITLEKHGCSQMLKAGAEGVLQSMMLSFGGLQFKNDHLEFRTEPKDLHRDYYFRRINYGNNTHVNISVTVGDDNKAVLYVALDRNDKPYYACDAGCLDPPVKLGNHLEKFPVKITDPFTAILYVTYDLQHMTELKQVVHVREIAEAPAHEHHVMALHRHGHHYGGLPMLFWISIGFLIAIFHMFLFKLVFNEYCQSTEPRYVRGKYNL